MKKKKNMDIQEKTKTDEQTNSQQAEDINETKEFTENETKTAVTEDISELQNKIAELNDKFLRLYSEFENFRKRTYREKIELGKTATTEVILTLLPIVDDFDRAIKAIENTEQIDSVSEGFILIYAKFKKVLNQLGVEEIKSVGEVFNTDLHEAVTNIASESEDNKGKVVEEILKGYLLQGKVIRYAKVTVAN